MASLPEIRKGCDLAVEFNLVDQLGVERLLRRNGLMSFLNCYRYLWPQNLRKETPCLVKL